MEAITTLNDNIKEQNIACDNTQENKSYSGALTGRKEIDLRRIMQEARNDERVEEKRIL